jgi:hypothetical protein
MDHESIDSGVCSGMLADHSAMGHSESDAMDKTNQAE